MTYPGPRRSPLARIFAARRARRAQAPGSRGRFGLWGPIPHYTRRTRGGGEVSVGGCGCCLPIPLIGVLGSVAGLRALWRKVR